MIPPAILDRFLTELRATSVPLVALWVHGSLAMGDYQPGRSDLDLVAVVEAELDETRKSQVDMLHRRLIAEDPGAELLHCNYPVRSRLADDTALRHVTFRHGHLTETPVTPVTRRELLTAGLVLHGPSPAGLVPPVSDQDLNAFVRADLAGFWRPVTGKPLPWLRDVWVDSGPVTLARATVTLREGRLITKGEALDVLAELGAPAELIDGIRARRYGTQLPPTPWYRRPRRARLARTFVRSGIDRALGQA
ncbi:nucleotidyltransferase domain-containing protein [Streptomyces sp. NBC_01537]|uniref:nucleotidyltransferase domain-containing protein n=1 Tax=Streptomyces sp. NBC_01537 TaxID=2903896 RepID=UPI003866A6B3